MACITDGLDGFHAALCEVELRCVKDSMRPILSALKGDVLILLNNGTSETIDYDVSLKQCEHVALRLACLPDSDTEKKVGLAAISWVKSVFEKGATLSLLCGLNC